MILGKFRHFWSLLYQPCFTDEGHIRCAIAYPWYTLMCQIVLIGLFTRPLASKNHNFCHILDCGILWCRQLAAFWESWAQVHNYKPSPIKRYQNRFCTPLPSWRNCTNSYTHKGDEQTDKMCFLATPVVGEIRAPPNLAWWWRTLSTFLHLNNFWGPTRNFTARGCSRFGGIPEPHPLNLKPPNYVTHWGNSSKF